jgi:hypothetical protein
MEMLAVIAESSARARDAILCLGRHTSRTERALSAKSGALVVAPVTALNKGFSNRAGIDSETFTACFASISRLLALPYPVAVRQALGCFVAIANGLPTLFDAVYELQLIPSIVGMLSNPGFVRCDALPLVGNFALGEPSHIETLLRCDLFEVLRRLVRAHHHAADVVWVLSNLREFIADTVATGRDRGDSCSPRSCCSRMRSSSRSSRTRRHSASW